MSPTRSNAYRIGGLTMVIAAAVIIAALLFEHVGGYIPCPLCLKQRWAYYGGVPALFAAMTLVGAERPRAAALLFLAVAIAFLANSGVGVYQAGAEWGFWPGPETCGTLQPITGSAADLLKNIETTRVIRCDEASWRFAGLSFAGWNAVVSFALFVTALKAAFAASERR